MKTCNQIAQDRKKMTALAVIKKGPLIVVPNASLMRLPLKLLSTSDTDIQNTGENTICTDWPEAAHAETEKSHMHSICDREHSNALPAIFSENVIKNMIRTPMSSPKMSDIDANKMINRKNCSADHSMHTLNAKLLSTFRIRGTLACM